MNSNLTLAPAVAAALAEKRAVVALEIDADHARAALPRQRRNGAGDGRRHPRRGRDPRDDCHPQRTDHGWLDADEIEALAKAKNVRKCSRRDLALAVGLGEDGATTVAGTMIVAHMAGIRVFATGGIGGVHRGHPFDVSADLIELGRTPVAVVCSGAKVDPRPAADARSAGNAGRADRRHRHGYAARFLHAAAAACRLTPASRRRSKPRRSSPPPQRLGMTHGMLFTVPVPPQHELPPATAEAAISQATDEAEAAGIHGKAVTPYVLARVAELTEGESRSANTALLSTMRASAAQIALALADLL